MSSDPDDPDRHDDANDHGDTDDRAIAALVADLHEHLEATAALPVETSASRWLGEAEAVTGDLVGDDVPESVVAERVEHVAMLLSNVDSTGSEAADDHVAAARELVGEIEAELNRHDRDERSGRDDRDERSE